MANTNLSELSKPQLEVLKLNNQFSLKELEQMLHLKMETIERYCHQFKDFLTKKENYNQKDIHTIILIQSMVKKGLQTQDIKAKICEYEQVMKKTMAGKSSSTIKFMSNYPKASGLTGSHSQ